MRNTLVKDQEESMAEHNAYVKDMINSGAGDRCNQGVRHLLETKEGLPENRTKKGEDILPSLLLKQEGRDG